MFELKNAFNQYNQAEKELIKEFHRLTSEGDIAGMEVFLKKYGRAFVNCRNKYGQTPLMQVVVGNLSFQNAADVVRFLLKNGADVNGTNNSGCSVLMIAEWNRDRKELHDLLISHGALLNEADYDSLRRQEILEPDNPILRDIIDSANEMQRRKQEYEEKKNALPANLDEAIDKIARLKEEVHYAYEQGRKEGYDQGWDGGYNQGDNQGRKQTWNEAWSKGYDQGQKEGYQRGQINGYSEGRNAAVQQTENRDLEAELTRLKAENARLRNEVIHQGITCRLKH